jgi:hypothetical protein
VFKLGELPNLVNPIAALRSSRDKAGIDGTLAMEVAGLVLRTVGLCRACIGRFADRGSFHLVQACQPLGTLKNWRQNWRQLKTSSLHRKHELLEITTELMASRQGLEPATLSLGKRNKGEGNQ